MLGETELLFVYGGENCLIPIETMTDSEVKDDLPNKKGNLILSITHVYTIVYDVVLDIVCKIDMKYGHVLCNVHGKYLIMNLILYFISYYISSYYYGEGWQGQRSKRQTKRQTQGASQSQWQNQTMMVTVKRNQHHQKNQMSWTGCPWILKWILSHCNTWGQYSW